jgi:spore maturation protein SpmA
MHGTDILNTALIKHFLATGVKGLEDRVGTPPVGRRPELSHLELLQAMDHSQTLKTNADEGLLVPADSSVVYIPASIFLRRSIRSSEEPSDVANRGRC